MEKEEKLCLPARLLLFVSKWRSWLQDRVNIRFNLYCLKNCLILFLYHQRCFPEAEPTLQNLLLGPRVGPVPLLWLAALRPPDGGNLRQLLLHRDHARPSGKGLLHAGLNLLFYKFRVLYTHVTYDLSGTSDDMDILLPIFTSRAGLVVHKLLLFFFLFSFGVKFSFFIKPAQPPLPPQPPQPPQPP